MEYIRSKNQSVWCVDSSPWVSLERAELHCKAALYKVEIPFAACMPGSGSKPAWRSRRRNSANRRSTWCSALYRWRQVLLVCWEGDPSGELATSWRVSWLQEPNKTTMIRARSKIRSTVYVAASKFQPQGLRMSKLEADWSHSTQWLTSVWSDSS